METTVSMSVIEYERLKKLEEMITEQHAVIDGLRDEVKRVDRAKIDEESAVLAGHMFRTACKALFNSIGIHDIDYTGMQFKYLKENLGEDFYNDTNIKVTIGTSITNQFKKGIVGLNLKS